MELLTGVALALAFFILGKNFQIKILSILAVPIILILQSIVCVMKVVYKCVSQASHLARRMAGKKNSKVTFVIQGEEMQAQKKFIHRPGSPGSRWDGFIDNTPYFNLRCHEYRMEKIKKREELEKLIHEEKLASEHSGSSRNTSRDFDLRDNRYTGSGMERLASGSSVGSGGLAKRLFSE